MNSKLKWAGTFLPEIQAIELNIFSDARGSFSEIFNMEKPPYSQKIPSLVQDNFSISKKGVLRGLHFQEPNAQGKLVSVLKGQIFDVAVDIRKDSPTLGKWMGLFLEENAINQIWIPPGFAHGFQVTSEECYFLYKCSDYYRPANEHTILWKDKNLAIDWPSPDSALVSEKDSKGKRFLDVISES